MIAIPTTRKMFGRKTIYANYTEKQLITGSQEEKDAKVLDVLSNSIGTHLKNSEETEYLIAYLYGDQDIKHKQKLTRPEINNKSVENWAYAFVDWKKTFLLGKPMQYAPINDIATDEIVLLNKYNTYENKQWLDLDLYNDVLSTGRGFRYINSTKVTEEDEAPFEIINLEPAFTECIYSSSIGHEQIASFYRTPMISIEQQVNPETGKKEEIRNDYNSYTFYTRNRVYYINDKDGNYTITDSKPLLLNEHLIVEYYNNNARISMIELGKDIFDDINYVESLDKDDIEAFVNSIMVFTNAEFDEEGLDNIKLFGALSIKSSSDKPAKVELLQSRLKSLDTQIYYLRKLNALHNILSVPQASNSSETSNAETGKATMTGQGFTSASIRVEGEEQAFKKCDRKSLKTLLKICKRDKDSGIDKLKVSDIEIKLCRDMSDNILVKTQALMNLQSSNIPPEIRNAVIGLFSDPVSVTVLQKKYEEEQAKLEEELNKTKQNDNNANKINEQNNDISKTLNIQEQGN